jgi:cytochrome c biogenesis protein CcdA
MKKRSEKNIKTKQKKEIKKQFNIFAIIGFVMSFLSWFSILGIAFCIIGIIEAKRKNQKGRTLAIVGLIIGIIVLYATSQAYFLK